MHGKFRQSNPCLQRVSSKQRIGMSSRTKTLKVKRPQLLAYGRQSGYGDIHYPTLSCKEERRTPKPVEDYISKSMGRSEALREVQRTSALRQRKFDFVIVPEEFCEGEGNLRAGKGSERKNLQRPRFLLISKYGGKTVRETTYEMLKQASRIYEYRKALYELRDNVEKMNKENFFHRDITDANMTYNETEGKAYLIDFEHTDRTPTVNSPSSNNSPMNLDPDDEKQFVNNAIAYFEDGLDSMGLLQTVKTPSSSRSSKKSSSRTGKISRPRSI
jgi:hypothetical protein